eukprot:g8560.t1
MVTTKYRVEKGPICAIYPITEYVQNYHLPNNLTSVFVFPKAAQHAFNDDALQSKADWDALQNEADGDHSAGDGPRTDGTTTSSATQRYLNLVVGALREKIEEKKAKGLLNVNLRGNDYRMGTSKDGRSLSLKNRKTSVASVKVVRSVQPDAGLDKMRKHRKPKPTMDNTNTERFFPAEQHREFGLSFSDQAKILDAEFLTLALVPEYIYLQETLAAPLAAFQRGGEDEGEVRKGHGC